MSDVSHAVRGSTVFDMSFLPVLTHTLFENFQPEKLIEIWAISKLLQIYLSDEKSRRIRKVDQKWEQLWALRVSCTGTTSAKAALKSAKTSSALVF